MSAKPQRSEARVEHAPRRAKLIELIKQKSFSRGTFKLASGKTSDYYLDMKPTMFSPEGADALAEMILDRAGGLQADYIGGVALGAVPLVSNATMLSHRRGRPLPGFFVRKEVKDHGTMKRIEGLSKGETLAGKRVVILDDVTTTGGSAMLAVEAAREAGAQVVLVLSTVDREEGAAEFYRAQGIPFDALLTKSDLFLD